MEECFDQSLVAYPAFLGQLTGPLNVGDGQPDGNVLRGHGAATAVLQQQIRDQITAQLDPLLLDQLIVLGAACDVLDALAILGYSLRKGDSPCSS